MPSFRVPGVFRQQRRSFARLRSFHLSPTEAANAIAPPQAPVDDTKSLAPVEFDDKMIIQPQTTPLRPANLVIPLRGKTIATLAIISSLFFIMAISFSFIGADADEPFFKKTLDSVAENNPGIVLLGESVDVDIDEPSITVRWSIAACGEQFMLPGSAGAHGSDLCGLPATAIRFFVDSDDDPTATYDPADIPINRDSGHRRSIQNLVRFDSDHVLDVHEARLYPFDSYFLSSTIRAETFDNKTVPISKLATIDIVSSFDIGTIDLDSYSTTEKGAEIFSRDIDMNVSRPYEARLFTILLFSVSWILAHVTIGHVIIARRLSGLKSILPHLISSGAILIAIPQLRGSMPDAPGFDGVLIDSIGYFPQMVIVGICTITLLLILVVREFDNFKPSQINRPPSISFPARFSISRHMHMAAKRSSVTLPQLHHQSQYSYPHHRDSGSQLIQPPRTPNANSSSVDIAQWEMHRLLKQLKGQYVFPPVKPSHRIQPSEDHGKAGGHRRVKTMSKIMEAGEVPHSHWSGDSGFVNEHKDKSKLKPPRWL